MGSLTPWGQEKGAERRPLEAIRNGAPAREPQLTTPEKAGILYTFSNLQIKELRIPLGESAG